MSLICKGQSCNIYLCKYRHSPTHETIETVAIDINKICDEILALTKDTSHIEEEDILSDSFIDKIMKARETKLNIVSNIDDDDHDIV